MELEAPRSTAVPGGEETCCFYLLSFLFFFIPFRSSSDRWNAFRIPDNESGSCALQKTTLVSWHPASPLLLCGLFKAEELRPPCSGEGLRAIGTRALTVGGGRVSVPLGSSQEHRQGRVGHVVALGRAPSTQLRLLLPCSTATTRPGPAPLLSGGFLPSFSFFLLFQQSSDGEVCITVDRLPSTKIRRSISPSPAPHLPDPAPAPSQQGLWPGHPGSRG